MIANLAAFLVSAVAGLLTFVTAWWLATVGIPGPRPPYTYLVLLLEELPIVLSMGVVPFLVVHRVGRRRLPAWPSPWLSAGYGLVWYPLWWASFMVGRRVEWHLSRGLVTDALIDLGFRWVLPAAVAYLLIFAGYRLVGRAKRNVPSSPA